MAPVMEAGADQRAAPIPRTVLLFSCGLDSVVYAHVLRPDVLLYIPTGAPYQQKETDALPHLAPFLHTKVTWERCKLFLAPVERPDGIVPGRNAHLVLLAAHHGDGIWLGRTEGDRTGDGNEEFHVMMETLLNHMWADRHWSRGRSFSVSAPMQTMTKAEQVEYFLRRNGNPAALLASVSCYDPSPGHCGVCKPCMRKRVALECNGIVAPEGYWREDFWRADWWPELAAKMEAGTYRGREDQEVLNLVRARGLSNSI